MREGRWSGTMLCIGRCHVLHVYMACCAIMQLAHTLLSPLCEHLPTFGLCYCTTAFKWTPPKLHLHFKLEFKQADEEGVDVVVVSPDSEPPLARLVTFSKYKYEIERASKDKAKAASKQETKEIRMRPVTDVADFQVRRDAFKYVSVCTSGFSPIYSEEIRMRPVTAVADFRLKPDALSCCSSAFVHQLSHLFMARNPHACH